MTEILMIALGTFMLLSLVADRMAWRAAKASRELCKAREELARTMHGEAMLRIDEYGMRVARRMGDLEERIKSLEKAEAERMAQKAAK